MSKECIARDPHLEAWCSTHNRSVWECLREAERAEKAEAALGARTKSLVEAGDLLLARLNEAGREHGTLECCRPYGKPLGHHRASCVIAVWNRVAHPEGE
jgi:hypothetical protein